jgi:hypothetical protein
MTAKKKKPKVNEGEQLFRFQCKAYGLPEPKEQYFWARALGREFRADFAFVEYGLLVEIQGGIWTRGAHGHPLGIKSDIEKSQYACLGNWLRFLTTPDEVRSKHAVAWVQRALAKRGWIDGTPVNSSPIEQPSLIG